MTEYTTNDLSKILDVSTNTIRRYEEKGFLRAIRNESNGYRQFDHTDVEKLMYVNKYRKIGFTQEEIADIFKESISDSIERYEQKMRELDEQIKKLQAFRHLVKDDHMMMSRVKEFGDKIVELSCSSIHYILYQNRGNVNLDKPHSEALHRFMRTCPEFEYIYYFDRSDVETRKPVYSEGICSNQIFTELYEIDVEPPIMFYEERPCVMKFVRLPFDFGNRELMSAAELNHVLFGQFFDYMEKHGYRLSGDVVGLKICISREEGHEWQYVLMQLPIE